MSAEEREQIEKLNQEIKDYISKFDLNYLNNLLNAINNKFLCIQKDNIVSEDWSIYFENAMVLYKIIGKSFEQKFANVFFKYNKWGYYIDGKISQTFSIEKATQTLLFSTIISYKHINKQD